MANYDILGNIAVIKFSKGVEKKEKLEKAIELMKQYKTLRTVVEKADKVSGRLRTMKIKHLLGQKNLIADYKESGCRFKFNIETCYFSPRLSNERIEIAKLIAKTKVKNVLVMFAGVAPFPIIISKYANPKKIVAIELGRECCKYARENLRLNKIYSGIEIIQGDVKKISQKLKEKFDAIVMPRPNLKEKFLKEALNLSKRNTKIIYYGFSKETKKDDMILDLEREAKKCRKKIKILDVKEAGDIAPYEHRYRIEILVY